MKLTKEKFKYGILNKGWLDNNGVLTIPAEYNEFEGLCFYSKPDIKNLTFNINGEQKKFMDAVKKFIVLGNVKDCSGLNFSEMKALEEFSAHGSFSKLSALMFSGTGIKILEVPSNVRIIHMGAISDMPNLERLIIPYGAVFEKDTNFKTPISFISSCPKLKEVSIPEGAKSTEFVRQCVKRENKNRPEAEKIKINYVKNMITPRVTSTLAKYDDKTKKLLANYLNKIKTEDPDGIQFKKGLVDEIVYQLADLYHSKLIEYDDYDDEVRAIKSYFKHVIDIQICFAKKQNWSSEEINLIEDLKNQVDKADSLGLLKEIWFNITHVFDYFFNRDAFYKAKNAVRLKKLDEFTNGNKNRILERPKTNDKNNKQQQHLPN